MRFDRRPLVVMALLLLIGCSKTGADADKQALRAEPIENASSGLAVQFAAVTERTLPPTLEASGTLAADETSEVASQGAGAVLKVNVDVGSRVAKGDALVELDGRDASLRLSAANAGAAQAMARLGLERGQPFDPQKVAEVRAAKEAMDLAVLEADRTKTMFETGGVPQAALDQAKTRAEQARAQYEAALNGAKQAWASLASAQSQASLSQKAVSDMVIRAPFDGGISERRISPGEYAQPGKVVVVLVRDNPLRLQLDIAEADAGKVSVGKDVSLTVAAFPGRIFHGTIKRIGASVKAQSRTLPVEAEVPNSDGLLRPGFFAKAEVAVEGKPVPTLWVPRAAVGTSGSAARVFVRSGNRVLERIVSIGREADGLVEVKGDLAAKDEVAVQEVEKLTDGAEVRPAS